MRFNFQSITPFSRSDVPGFATETSLALFIAISGDGSILGLPLPSLLSFKRGWRHFTKRQSASPNSGSIMEIRSNTSFSGPF